MQISCLQWQNCTWFQAMILEGNKWLEKLKLASLVARRTLRVTGWSRVHLPEEDMHAVLLPTKLSVQTSSATGQSQTQSMQNKCRSQEDITKEWVRLTAANSNESTHPGLCEEVPAFNGLWGSNSWNTKWHFDFPAPGHKTDHTKHTRSQEFPFTRSLASLLLGFWWPSYRSGTWLTSSIQAKLKVSIHIVKKLPVSSSPHHLNSVWKPLTHSLSQVILCDSVCDISTLKLKWIIDAFGITANPG